MTDLLRELNLELTAEDFKDALTEVLLPSHCAQIANAILRERVKGMGVQKMIRLGNFPRGWVCCEGWDSVPEHTHSAYLLGVRELEGP